MSKCECVTRLAGLVCSSINHLCLAEENLIFVLVKNHHQDSKRNISSNNNISEDKIFVPKCECVTRLAGLVCSSINHLCLARGQVTSPCPPPDQCSLILFFCLQVTIEHQCSLISIFLSPGHHRASENVDFSFAVYWFLMIEQICFKYTHLTGNLHLPQHHTDGSFSFNLHKQNGVSSLSRRLVSGHLDR